MFRIRVLGGFAASLLVLSCSDPSGNKPSGTEKPSAAPARVVAPMPPAQAPELPEVSERDADGNRLDDVLDEQLRRAALDAPRPTEPLTVQAILKTPVKQADLDDFAASGGKVRYVFRELRAREWLSRSISRPIHPG